jgi:hypothetical protein
MDAEAKSKWFIVVGEALIKSLKMEDTLFYVQYIPRDQSFRVMIEKGKDGKFKKGFAVPRKMKLKEYERIFEQKLDELKTDASRGGGGLFSL